MATVIAVRGNAEERTDPELAAVTLTVGVSEPERDTALARTAQLRERVIAEIRDLDAAGALDSWAAGQLRIWSHRPWNNEGRQLPLVHQTSSEIEIVFTDLDRLGEWVSRVADAEGVDLNGVDWRLTEPTRRRVQELAQRAAVADAVAKALVYASALGLGTPTPVELADTGLLTAQPAPPAPRVGMKFAMASLDGGGADGAGTEFAPAELVVEASVDARFHAESA